MLRPSWGATALAFHGAPARLPSPLPINKAARNAERFRAAGWTNHAPDKVHGKRDRLRSHDRLLWNWIKLLGFDGAYPAEDVQQLLNTCSENDRRKVIEELYERARAKGLTR
jgi:hypothetical protein